MSRIDPHLLAVARRSVNFGLLEPIEPLLALYTVPAPRPACTATPTAR